MQANVTEATAQARLNAAGFGRIWKMWPWAPLPIAAAYLLVLVVKFKEVLANVYLNADAASAPVIGELYGGAAAHRDVILGQMGWYSTLLFELLTRWLPAHRELWEAAPYAMALASVALIAWSAWRVGGRWSAAITGMLVLCAGPRTLTLLFSLNDHSTSWFSLALLVGLLVLLEERGQRLPRWGVIALVLVCGVVVGANAGSDLVLVVAGIVPLLLAASCVWLLRPGPASSHAWWWLLATMGVGAVAYIATRRWAHGENVIVPPQYIHNQLASAESIPTNFKLWWQSLMVLGNGNFFGAILGFTSSLQLVCALLSLTVVLLIPWLARRELLVGYAAHRGQRYLGDRHDKRNRRDDGNEQNYGDGRRNGRDRLNDGDGDGDDRREALRIAWVAFWGSSAVLLSASFVFSSNPVDILSSRYLVGVIYAGAALVPLMAGGNPPLRMLVTGGCAIFALSGLVSLVKGEEITPAAGSYKSYEQVVQIAKREHLTVGYADYWDAAPLMWTTHFGVRAYPVQDCAPNICWSYLHEMTSWYTPRPGVRTFLISDPSQPIPAAPLPILGKAIATHQIGAMTMYVYSYDIASHFQP